MNTIVGEPGGNAGILVKFGTMTTLQTVITLRTSSTGPDLVRVLPFHS